MPHRGWLLDSYIRGKDAHLWLKTVERSAIHLTERHRPHFIANPKHSFNVDDLVYLLEEHKFVHSVTPVERYPTLRRECLKLVAEVLVDSINCLDEVIKYAKSLKEVDEVYDVGLSPIQWYLIEKGIAPTSLCEFESNGNTLKSINPLNDEENPEPPPFKPLIIRVPDSKDLTLIDVLDADERHHKSFRGEEKIVLSELKSHLEEEDPDIIVINNTGALKWVVKRASWHAIDLGFGREGELYHGRIALGYHSWKDMGLAGLSERSLFTYAPMGISSDWEAGKTIDSRQCLEAYRRRILIPEMKGGYISSMSAWDMLKNDKGGMLFTPQIGLHENVGSIDFESMFPSIINRKNVSYETVVEEGIDQTHPGFLGGFTTPTLERRLRFKHLQDQFSRNSPEWAWCEERQASLKLMLVVIYGYSGCYANRFANVQVFQEINRQARQALVKALNIALNRGFEVIYGNTDALYTKRANATKTDYEELATEIAEATGLPIKLDKHFKFFVLLGKVTDTLQGASNRYYGKLTDGRFFYRGIELRKHDTPVYLKRLQEKVITALFNAEDGEEVFRKGLPRALTVANRALEEVGLGSVNAKDLVISKRLSRELRDYQSLQVHVVAALLGAEEEGNSRYILVNSENSNPYLRVKPALRVEEPDKGYDCSRYVELTKRAIMSLLSPFIENLLCTKSLVEYKLDNYVD